MSVTPGAPVGNATPQGRSKPFTSAEISREPARWARDLDYGERVKDVTTHPAFRNTVRMLAGLYDALHDERKAHPLHTDRHRQRRLYPQVLQGSAQRRGDGRLRAMRSPNGRA